MKRRKWIRCGVLLIAAALYLWAVFVCQSAKEDANLAHLPLVNTITDEQMHLLEQRFGVKAREGYLK